MKHFKFKLILLSLALIISTFFGGVFATAGENIQNTSGTLNNIVILVSFSDNDRYVNGTFADEYYSLYNNSQSGYLSVKNYFNEMSMGKLDYNAVFADENSDDTIIPVQLKNPRNYYLPAYYADNTETNFSGSYDNRQYENGRAVDYNNENTKKHIDAFIRENLMIRYILSRIQIDTQLNLDNNADGNIDNISFIMADNILFNDGNIWSELLWPHMTKLMNLSKTVFDNFYYTEDILSGYGITDENMKNYGDMYINGLKVSDYNLLSGGYLYNSDGSSYTNGDTADCGVICHELMHALGLMDYYSYEQEKRTEGYESVGKFDLMASTDKNPQYLLSYLREKMGWLDSGNFENVTKSGQYTLFPVNSGNEKKAIKIKLENFDTDEYFMIEARSGETGTFDKVIGGTGIIIYRIDKKAAAENNHYGNMFGNDEIYIFRDYDYTNNKYYTRADSGLFGENKSYGSTNTELNVNAIFYQGTDNSELKDKNSGITVKNIKTNNNGSVTFSVTLPELNSEPEKLEPEPIIEEIPANEPVQNESRELFYKGFPAVTKNSGGFNLNIKTNSDCNIYLLALKNKADITENNIKSYSFQENLIFYKTYNTVSDKLKTIYEKTDSTDYYLYILAENSDYLKRLSLVHIQKPSGCSLSFSQNHLIYIFFPFLLFIILKRKIYKTI